ncbi:hypothetical protein THOM_2284, partial [Trachipleistophora hominis]
VFILNNSYVKKIVKFIYGSPHLEIIWIYVHVPSVTRIMVQCASDDILFNKKRPKTRVIRS